MKLLVKYNSGQLAIICSKCRVIIKTGLNFTQEELDYAQGKLKKPLPPQYCKNCKKKMKKRTPFLDIYNRCVAAKGLPERNGLCTEINIDALTYEELHIWWNIFPTHEDIQTLMDEDTCITYWGEDKKSSTWGIKFTPRRQTILLLCAVMNNEY